MSFFSDITDAFRPNLPENLGTMDQHLDFVLPKVIPFGEDLREQSKWLSKRWKEVREEEGFHEAILHIFNTGGEYLLSLDGNIVKGAWRQLGNDNTLIIEIAGKSELFDLRFLNGDFLILTKHGDQARKGQRKYFFLVNERASKEKGRELDWRNLAEKMFNIYRENTTSLGSWVVFILVLALIIFLSTY